MSETRFSGKSFLVRCRTYFVSGLLFSLPLVLSIYVLTWIVTTVDQWIKYLVPEGHFLGHFSPFLIPGTGVLVVVIFLTFVGAITKGFFGKMIAVYSERIFSKMPIVRTVYSTTKQISETVLQSQSQSFREVGMIEYPKAGTWVLCFMTGCVKGEIQKKTCDDIVSVFVPTTPNPTSGFLLFVSRKDIVPINISVEAGIKMVVSAGMIAPSELGDPKRRS